MMTAAPPRPGQVRSGLVSTIIPVHNRPRLVREAVQSVLRQEYRPIEVIVCDDESTDDTAAAVEELAQHNPGLVTLLRLSHRGQGPAREAGRLLAAGEFLQYLDSDDRLRPRKFAVQVQALRDHPECGVAYGLAAFWRSGRPPVDEPYKWTGHGLPTLFPWLLVDRWWTTEAPLYRRSLCDAIGPWSDLKMFEDWEYDGRVGALGTRLVHCPEFVSDHCRHEGEPHLTDPADWGSLDRLRDRTRFFGLMLAHAQAAGTTPEAPEMQHFSRWLFAAARECAAAGLEEQARRCLEWARLAAGPARAGGRDFRLWDVMVRLTGAKAAGRLARFYSRLRGTTGPATLKESWMPGAAPRLPLTGAHPEIGP